MVSNLPQKKTNRDIILEKRYLLRDEEGEIIEDRIGMLWRVAKHLTDDKEEQKTFFNMMESDDFLPNSPTLVNAGNPFNGTLSACFVLSPDDNIESIWDTLKQASLIVKTGGGVGFFFGNLRPKGDRVRSTNKSALGPIAVMEDYSVCLNSLTQVGSFRNAALMGQLQVSHPDIFDFIHCKDSSQNLSNFNISVQVTDKFMMAVENNLDWDLINPRTNKIVRTVKARDIWAELIASAHLTGDPGLVFIDRVTENQPNPNIGVFGSNPCSEQFLENFNSCNLGSINLGNFVVNGKWDYARLRKTVHNAVKFLNRVIDVNIFPFQELKDMSDLTRRIGLGVMGWADALVKLGIPYDSKMALKEADIVGNWIYDAALLESQELAKKDGSFPNFEFSIFNDDLPVRNSCLISIAPTGTISRLSNSSFGIEPYFALAWHSNILWEGNESTELLDCPRPIREALEKTFPGAYGEEQINKYLMLLRDADSDEEKKDLLESIGLKANLFPTANDIQPLHHVDMLSAWQKWCTNGTSKTVNMPHDSSISSVGTTYSHAWQKGCKGITVYRERTREKEVLGKGNHVDLEFEDDDLSFSRPSVMRGTTHRILTGHGNMYVTVNADDRDKLREVISNIGRSGGCSGAAIESVSRLVSLCLRSGVEVSDIIKQLNGITCCPVWHEGELVQSPFDAISKILGQYTETEKVVKGNPDNHLALIQKKDICTSCNSGVIINVGGCDTCSGCGVSKCG